VQAEIDQFLDWLALEEHCTANTVAAYRNDLQQLRQHLAHLGEVDSWAHVTPEMMQSYLRHLWGRGYASSTVSRKLSALRSFFRFLTNRDISHSDPLAAFVTPVISRSVPQPLQHDAVIRLLALPSRKMSPSSIRDRALLELLYATGLKVSEVVRLEVEDVSIASSTLRCAARGRERLIPLPLPTKEALDIYITQGRIQFLQDRDESALFLNYRGRRLSRQGLWLLVQKYAKEAGLDGGVSPQMLRRSYAAHLLSEGVQLTEVQELLGHVALHTTRAYAGPPEGADALPR
jgi:integrase/recombinase XerD